MTTTDLTPTGRPRNMRLTGPEAQYAMRYLRHLAERRDIWPPHGLVESPERRARIEMFVQLLLDEALEAGR